MTEESKSKLKTGYYRLMIYAASLLAVFFPGELIPSYCQVRIRYYKTDLRNKKESDCNYDINCN